MSEKDKAPLSEAILPDSAHWMDSRKPTFQELQEARQRKDPSGVKYLKDASPEGRAEKAFGLLRSAMSMRSNSRQVLGMSAKALSDLTQLPEWECRLLTQTVKEAEIRIAKARVNESDQVTPSSPDYLVYLTSSEHLDEVFQDPEVAHFFDSIDQNT